MQGLTAKNVARIHNMNVIDLSNEEESDCPICLDGFSDSRVKFVTECNHSYHEVCFMKLHKQECAMCRKKLKIVPPGYKPKLRELSQIKMLAQAVLSGSLTPNEIFQQMRAMADELRAREGLIF
jgi:hypothetical protein